MNINKLFNPMTEPMRAWYASQTAKDQKLLALLSVFLLVASLGFGVFSLHKAAEKSAKTLSDEKNLLSWMGTQYANLELGNGIKQPLSELIQTSASSMGLTASVTQQGDGMQVSTSHNSFAVLGNFLTVLAQQGTSINALSIQQQADGILQLQATMSKK